MIAITVGANLVELLMEALLTIVITVQFQLKLLITTEPLIVTITVGLVRLLHFLIMNCQTLSLQIIITTAILKCNISIQVLMMHTFIKA